jgi:hypothetical protein
MLLARAPEWQLEKSWAEHEPLRRRIPPEAWRALRNFKRRIGPLHDRVEAACTERKTIWKLILDYSRKSGIGSQRAYAKVVRHFHPAAVEKLKKGILWTWLQPRGAILADAQDYGEAQDAVLVRYGLGWGKRELVCYLAFSLEVPDHCLARLIQRAPGADLHEVLRQYVVAIVELGDRREASARAATQINVAVRGRNRSSKRQPPASRQPLGGSWPPSRA